VAPILSRLTRWVTLLTLCTTVLKSDFIRSSTLVRGVRPRRGCPSQYLDPGFLPIWIRGCPLNHRATHRSYPQLWRSQKPSVENRLLWLSDPPSRSELQRCKLPTVWITPVDNFAARAPSCPAARTARHSGPGTLKLAGRVRCGKGENAVGNRAGRTGPGPWGASVRHRRDVPAQLLSPPSLRSPGNPGLGEAKTGPITR
jgi:hypothetical protein